MFPDLVNRHRGAEALLEIPNAPTAPALTQSPLKLARYWPMSIHFHSTRGLIASGIDFHLSEPM